MLKKIPFDLSPLWKNSEKQIVIRFQDINETKKETLALRIKKCAKQYKIKSLNGPTIKKIYETLTEINPVIFCESPYRAENNNHSSFNQNQVYSLSGYRFKTLCKLIHKIDCTKKPNIKKLLKEITNLTEANYYNRIDFIRNYERENPITQNQETIKPMKEIGIQDIQNIREKAETNNTITSL